jgi:beta-aspartyl-dipeptidase (metallo-type)
MSNHTDASSLRLFRGGHVYAPEDMGQQDVLIGGGKILAVGSDLSFPEHDLVEEIDASGLLILPGLIDSHVHILGGGGEGGPETRNRDILLSRITTAGVTTVIGMIGFDCLTRSMESLLAKARGLTIEGVSTYILTGGYEHPTPTITGAVRRDIAFIEQVVGVGEIAISDHRSSQPNADDLARIAAEARIGGLLGKKSGTLVLHIGNGPRGIQPIIDLLESTEIPKTQIVPTHVNRNPWLFEQSKEYASSGGLVDVTAGVAPALGFADAIKPSQAVREFLEAGADIRNVTMSSDANGNMPVFNDAGEVVGLLVQEVMHLYNETRDLVAVEGLPIEDALKPVTENIARIYRLESKGTISRGKDADLVITEPDLTIRHVYGRGRLLIQDGNVVVRGTYE